MGWVCSALPGPQQKEERKGTLIKTAIGAVRGGAAISPSLWLLTLGSFPLSHPSKCREQERCRLTHTAKPMAQLGLPGEMALESKKKVEAPHPCHFGKGRPKGPTLTHGDSGGVVQAWVPRGEEVSAAPLRVGRVTLGQYLPSATQGGFKLLRIGLVGPGWDQSSPIKVPFYLNLPRVNQNLTLSRTPQDPVPPLPSLKTPKPCGLS